MEVIFERSNILEPLSHACRIIDRKNAVPISYHILLQACDDGSLILKAKGRDIEITAVISVNVNVSGSFTVPAQLFYDIVRKLPDGSEISLSNSDKEEQVVVFSGGSRFCLQSFSELDFPMSKEENVAYSFAIESSVLKGLIDRTHFAMASEEIRYYLNGVFFHIAEGSKLCAAATDGHRLAISKTDTPVQIAEIPSIIVPSKAVGEIQRILAARNLIDSVKIGISESRIYLKMDSISMNAKLIDGEFPDYQSVVPDKNDKELRVNCVALRQAVDRVSTVSSISSQAVKCSLSCGKLRMTVDNPDMGQAVESLVVEYNDCDIDISFNYRYLLEIIDNVTSDDVVFLLADSDSSALIKGEGNMNTLYVLMPMRV
ncbi:MAG: DNA polymerase III subunit beta [Candidatus Liberibacter europaeus]|uniref:Beta sliding clamp n=1 Tax=Candidatus Liberibacter europaeus TaxID=744859 RepID=A0A2T4VYT7_9HYPH|nr:DNA polymerase III subunit beta [Candidatus Liberibacter europaeus]PTL86950.1 MAG: DNA polymerase III subunit beta [Candidatus Liberibacter europaeus]